MKEEGDRFRSLVREEALAESIRSKPQRPTPSPENGKGASLESATIAPSTGAPVTDPRFPKLAEARTSQQGAAGWMKAQRRVAAVRSEVDKVHGTLSLHTNLKADKENDSKIQTRFGATLLRRADVPSWSEEKDTDYIKQYQGNFKQAAELQKVAQQEQAQQTQKKVGRQQRVYPQPSDYLTPQEMEEHKQAFAGGAHAMISDWAHENAIRSRDEAGYGRDTGFGGLGVGSNFVGTIPEADAAMVKANLAHKAGNQEHAATRSLEDTYSLNKDQWKSDDDQIYRYQFNNLDESWGGAQIPTGAEFGADKDKWIAGGKTGSGAREATIKSVTTAQMKGQMKEGNLSVNRHTFQPSGVDRTSLSAEDINRKKEKRS